MEKNSKYLSSSLQISVLSVIIVFLLSSCATHISTRASLVKITSAEQAQVMEMECEFVGNVTGDSFWLWYGLIAHNNSLNEMLDNAAELGATHVFSNLGNYRDLRGEGYFCAFCQLGNGKKDVDRCLNADGDIIKATKRQVCEKRGNVWIPKAKDRMTCEAKDGTWFPNPDVLRVDPFGKSVESIDGDSAAVEVDVGYQE